MWVDVDSGAHSLSLVDGISWRTMIRNFGIDINVLIENSDYRSSSETFSAFLQ